VIPVGCESWVKLPQKLAQPLPGTMHQDADRAGRRLQLFAGVGVGPAFQRTKTERRRLFLRKIGERDPQLSSQIIQLSGVAGIMRIIDRGDLITNAVGLIDPWLAWMSAASAAPANC
jgi:hypothetical protein